MSQRIKSIFKKFRNIILFGHLDPIEYYVIDDLKLVYVENAKVACTSIKRVLYKVPEDIGMEIHEYLRPLAQMELKGAQLEYDIFTVKLKISVLKVKGRIKININKKTYIDVNIYFVRFTILSNVKITDVNPIVNNIF